MEQFGDRLAELRNDRKMTQKQLAAMLYVTPGTISNYENNVYFPDVEKLIALADLFHVTTDYLLGRCRDSLSPDVFQEIIIENRAMGDVIQDIQSITPDRRKVLLRLLDDLKLASLVGQYQEKAKQ